MKDAMTDRSPSAETIRFVIEILSARATPVAELPQTIAVITQALARLGAARGSEIALPAPIALPRPVARKPVAARPFFAKPAAPKAAPAIPRTAPEFSAEAAPPIVEDEKPPPTPRRGRPRRVEVVPPPVEEMPAVEVEPPQPRLLRRADALASEALHHQAEAPAVLRTPEGTLRGVVKWFDGRAGKGALRLAGVSGDVLLDPAALTRAGIKRLYKDQEIEATVEETGGRVRLLSLSLPARGSAEPTINMMQGEITGTLRRQPRSVQVQIKRDGIRQSAARAEAEQVLGGVGRIKAGRRLTP
jgi:cold shock CspA family protein